MTFPAAGTVYDAKPTLIMSIWCTSYAAGIILFRCAGRWRRTERVWVEDVILLFSILVLVARMVLANFVLKYGTNNVDSLSLHGEDDVRNRELGSQLVLICRLLYPTFLWMVKLSVGIYIARLTNQFWASKSVTSTTSGGRIVKAFLSRHLNHIFYAFLGLGYVAVIISELVQCRPFSDYWRVTPTPAKSCRVAMDNLIAMGILDIVTDFTLVALPLPMILGAKLPTKVKAETLLLMMFPLINVAFTCYRLPTTHATNGLQRYRTLMASINMLVSTASANALVVISFLQDRGFKKLKYRHAEGSEDRPLDRVSSTDIELQLMHNAARGTCTSPPFRQSHKPGSFSKWTSPLQSPRERMSAWGSDEDLMHDDSPDGGPSPSVRTTSANSPTHGIVEIEDSAAAGSPDAELPVRHGTCHLSPHERAETSIVAERRVKFGGVGKEEDPGLVVSAPFRRTSLHSGIVVETSWQVVRS